MSVEGFQEYKIGGVSILFPCKPYPSQFSMMDKIVKGIERRQNCLLESPTGSGKSLALLCSTLAWQRAEKEKFLKEEEQEKNVEKCCCDCHTSSSKLPSNSNQSSTVLPTKSTTKENVSPYFSNAEGKESAVDQIAGDDDDDDDFKQDGKKFKVLTSKNSDKNPRKHISISYDSGPLENCRTPQKPTDLMNDNTDCNSNTSKMTSPGKCINCSCHEEKAEKPTKRKIPKIYFGTRTHKQVAQIVRELRKTAYTDTRMTILASREHTCIHPVVSRSSFKNEGCQELLKGPGCSLCEKAKRVSSHLAMNAFGLTSAWDLEDIVDLLKKKKACPYFVTKGLKDCSDLIICPYNYLVDPVVRKSMEISLKGNIIILDEGHNIEDSAREAGSQTIMDDNLNKTLTDLDNLIEANIKLADHLKIKTMCSNLEMFIKRESEDLEQRDFDKACKIWSGFDIVAQLDNMKMGPKHFKDLMKSYNSICEEEEDQFKNMKGESVTIGSVGRIVLEQIFVVLEFMYRCDLKFVEDYRVSVVKSTSYTRKPNQHTNAVWLMSKRNRGGMQPNIEVNFSLNFWCMNPAVAFSDFVDCRCLVLTSGTLSPTSSFQSELGVAFPIQLEANHVIQDNQIWVGAIGQGPTGTSLQAVYRNVDTFAFQDELGELVLRVCETVPHGVLCFFSSYKMLEKVRERWKTTGLWRKILQKKKIISEPRSSDKVDFEELMRYFYKVVENGENSDDSDDEADTDGALFLAVCRGKVSEGLDFADNFARAVITVGIPYPNFKDIQVELKRKYNDLNRSRGLLSGSDWYEIQAFRALNQALGRCIRHRRDWGALILVDDRFVKNSQKYCKGLSKWVRNKTQTYQNFNQAMESLAFFTKNRIEASQKEGPNISLMPSTPSTPSSQPIVYQEPMTSPKTPFHDKLNTSTELSPQSSMKVHESDALQGHLQQVLDTSKPTRNMPPGTPTNMSFTSALTPDLGLKMASRQKIGTSNVAQAVSQKVRPIGQTFLMPQAGIVPGQKIIVLQDCKSPASVQNGHPVVGGSRTKQISLMPPHLQPSSMTSQFVLSPPLMQQVVNNTQQVFLVQLPVQSPNHIVQSPQRQKPLKDLLHMQSSGHQIVQTLPTAQNTSKLNVDNKINYHQNGLPVSLKSENDVIVVEDCNSQDSKEKLSSVGQKGDAQTINKFFKFCKIPNAATSEKSLINECNQVSSDSRVSAAASNDNETKINLKMPKVFPKILERQLFKDSSHSDTSLDVLPNDLVNTGQILGENSIKNVELCKKPLFRRKNSVSGTELEKMATDSNTDNVESCCENVKIESDIEMKSEEVKSDENKNVISSDHDDFEEPVIKRRSLRQKKRKSDGTFRAGNKRPKGLDFVDFFEKSKRKNQLHCCGCDSVLVQDLKDYEERKRTPSFLKEILEKKNAEVMHFTSLDLSKNLQVLTSDTKAGVCLNCVWDEDHAVCIQYLVCSTCEAGSHDVKAIGCRVVFSVDTSEFKTGETWLLSEMVK